MDHERYSSPTFPVVEIDEIEFSLLDPLDVYAMLHALALEQGYNPAEVLYIGVDLDEKLPHVNGFGDRRETWAFTDVETASGAKRAMGDDYDSRSPLYYALKGTAAPGVVLVDGTEFHQLGRTQEDSHTRTQLEYRMNDGMTFDDTVIGILRITTD